MSVTRTHASRPLRAATREVAWPRDAEAVFAVLSRRPGCVWLDGAGGPPALARWSVLAAAPSAILSHEHDTTRLRDRAGRTLLAQTGRPFEALREALAMWRLESGGPAAVPFGPGFYGYLGYDLAPYVEPKAGLSACPAPGLPELWLGLYEAVLVLDHEERRARLVGAAGPAWEAMETALDASASAVRRDKTVLLAGGPGWNMTRPEFMQAVERAKEYIAAGDIFQVNLSRRATVPLADGDGHRWADLYVRLRRTNPAPFAAFLDLGEGKAVLSSSPELFLACQDRHVVTRPIKGTRPCRPGDEAYNAVQRQALLDSAKDRAELVMIVDLERNDLGRVAEYGSVRVTEARTVEPYAAVHHTVATVEARLRDGCDLVDLLRATFPGGSITGAPKVRAMQIIAELEPTRRGVYTGAIGYLAPPGPDGPSAGGCRLNIAIRTFVADGAEVHLQVGGGIVADSDPAAEFEETEAKAEAALAALGPGRPAL